jgi:cystathionine gamma-synthase
VNDPKSKKPATSTEAVHAGLPREKPHHVLASGVAQTATYTFASSADLEQYMRGEDADPEREEYGRYGNPTVRELELRLAALENTEEAVCFASGMAAMSGTLLSLLKAGDHVVVFNDGYRRTRQMVTKVLPRFGIDHMLIPPGDLDALGEAIRPTTRVVVGESPTNPHLHCTDLERFAAIAKRHGRVKTVVDSTFATPINSRPHDFGVDIVVHSATKYLGGHNDVLGGVVTGATHLASLVRDTRSVLGAVLDPHAAFLIGRGLKTLEVRVQRQNATALAVAKAIEKHPRIEKVYYPGLESHPSHRVAAAQMRGFGGVVSFQVAGGRAGASKMVDGCRLATIASSLGGVETLIEQPCIMSYFELGVEELAAVGISPGLVRLSVGVEDTDDVVRDIVTALDGV